MKNTKANATANAWPEAVEAQLAEKYTGREMNDQLGKLVEGKTAAMVRSKLVSMGLYEKNEARAVGGASQTRKLDLVRGVEILTGLPKGSLDSLEKAKKDELDALASALTHLSDTHEAETE